MHSPSCSPQVLQLLSHKVDRDIIEYLVRTTIETVDFALGRPTSPLFPTPSTIPRPFLQLALDVIRRSRIETPVILVALVYLERARSQFQISDERWACERMLIGALVLSAKYVSDYTIKNARWARWSSTFSKEDIGRMERELLDILDWNLSVTEGDIMAHHEHLLFLIPPILPLTSPKRPPSPFRTDPGLSLELSPFCLPLPQNNSSTLTNKTRALTSSVTLPSFSSFLRNPYRHPLTLSPSSLDSSLPPVLSVTSGVERAYKRRRLVTDPRRPLGLANKHRHPVAVRFQQSTGTPTSHPLPLPWSRAFDPFLLPYIPSVSFYES